MSDLKPSYIRVSEHATASLNRAHDGVQIRVSFVNGFVNGYEASIVCHSGSYGHENNLWELAVTYNDKLCYDTATADVIGHLEVDEVEALLKRIEELPPKLVTEEED